MDPRSPSNGPPSNPRSHQWIEGFGANAAAALEAGFSPEAVNLIARLPYLDIESREKGEDWYDPGGDIEIMPSTFPLTYTTTDEPTANHYEGFRDMDDDPGNEDYLIPGTCIRLSWQNVYGTTWIYDTETCLLREWKSFDSEPEVGGFDHAPAKLPTEILGAWTEKYRKLLFIGYSGMIDFHPDEDWCPREDIQEDDLGSWQARHDVRVARLTIRDMYLDCGWNVNSMTQDAFDRKRFVEMGQRFLVEVLDPLEDRSSKYHNRRCSMEQLLRDTPEELKQWTATDYRSRRVSDEL
ncbi:hypothetical protein QQX98_003204 [Neonectria punicea]|uniref:Uncharacterized protein n=1 Tax=Neonectria punicea TaxID=979145 RepID=A0ABR1HFS1_9HYPO